MSIKKCKEIFRIGHEVFTRKFKACKELRESVDPEVKPLVRRKRLKECGYKRTDTLWIKKLEDKSWKARAKKAHQWIRHKLGLAEKELVGKVNHAVCDDITFRLIDGSWNKLHELYGDKTCKDSHIYRQKEFIMSLMYLYEHKRVAIIWRNSWRMPMWFKQRYPKYRNKAIHAVRIFDYHERFTGEPNEFFLEEK